jgi:hypothetical protein
MIAKVEKMNLRQENHEEGQETKDMLENLERIREYIITVERNIE